MRARCWSATALLGVAVLLWCVPAGAQDVVRAGVEQLAAQIAKAAPEGKQLRLAVADFPDLQGVTSDLGRFIANRLTTRLAQTPNFFVIERQRLGQVLAELKFSTSDLIDPAKAKQLGRMAGVEAIVVGTVSDLGNQVDLDARLIEIETNRMLLGATATISRDQVVDDLLKRGRQESVTSPSVPAAAPTVGAAPPPKPAFRYNHKVFTFDLVNVQVVDDEIKLLFTYTNRTESAHTGRINSTDVNRIYLVDNLGNRYRYTGDSFNRGRDFPPQVPETLWITFGKLQPASSSISLFMNWWWIESGRTRTRGGWQTEDVLIRGIPLKR